VRSTPDAAVVFEDAEKLQDWLARHEQRPYVDFEILTVTLSDGALELDPMGNAETLRPLLEDFARDNGYSVNPFDPETGTISLLRSRVNQN